jgi:hypothetical protein
MKRDNDLLDEVADLAARIDRFDRAREKPRPTQRPPERVAKAPISPREMATRRWTLAVFLLWGLLVFRLIVVQRWGQASVLELVLGFCFALLCVLGCYGFFLFYAELAKGIWGKLRRKGDGPA